MRSICSLVWESGGKADQSHQRKLGFADRGFCGLWYGFHVKVSMASEGKKGAGPKTWSPSNAAVFISVGIVVYSTTNMRKHCEAQNV